MSKRAIFGFFRHVKNYRPDVVSLILVGLLIFLWFRPPAFVTEQDTPAPRITMQLADGQTLSSPELLGKVVLVNFWATWCPYCRHEMPAMQSFYQVYKTQGFEILAPSIDDSPAAIANYMREKKYDFPAGRLTESAPAEFGPIRKIPVSFIIDKCGKIRKKVSGQLHYARLKDLVLPLLTERCST